MKEVEKKETVVYTKPIVIAQNKSAGSYAAGCPSNYMGTMYSCRSCDRAK